MLDENLRYPIGRWKSLSASDTHIFQRDVDDISTLPLLLSEKVKHVPTSMLSNTYREAGWTIAQIVHHLADSHMNGYIRHKLTMSEENPVIKPYLESHWANFPDACDTNLSHSLILLEALHERWVQFLKTISLPNLDRTYYHPEAQKTYTLADSISLYAWHGNHHLAHIDLALQN
jgi:uncharacterized damage-inducible protein DinB